MIAFLETSREFLQSAAPAMPPQAWLATLLVFALLAAAAFIDILKATVPDALIFFGLVATTAAQGALASWDIAALHLRYAILAGLSVWAINAVWYRLFRHDALGMGDAKWTMLAVACFGVRPSLFAWGAGAILGVLFLAVMRLGGRPVRRVTFAPFLLIGLCLGIYWLRFAV